MTSTALQLCGAAVLLLIGITLVAYAKLMMRSEDD